MTKEIKLIEKIDEKKYIVYKHTSPNNKSYIGITSKSDPNRRWQNGDGYISNNYFYSAIKKYGWENFKHEILYENLTQDQAYKKEIELIKKYSLLDSCCGYNLHKGGINNNKKTCKINISFNVLLNEFRSRYKDFDNHLETFVYELITGNNINLRQMKKIIITEDEILINTNKYIKDYNYHHDYINKKEEKINNKMIIDCCENKADLFGIKYRYFKDTKFFIKLKRYVRYLNKCGKITNDDIYNFLIKI